MVFLAAPGIARSISTWAGGPAFSTTIPTNGRTQVGPGDGRYTGYADWSGKQLATPYGVGMTASSINAAPNLVPYVPWTTALNTYTMMWFGQHTTANNKTALQIGDEGTNGSSSNFDQRDIALNWVNGSYSAGHIGFADYHGGYNTNIATTGTPLDGKIHLIIVVRSGATVTIYCDGISQPLTSVTATTTAFAPSPGLAFGSINSKNGPDLSLIGAAWNYDIPRDIAEEISLHPWSLWHKPRMQRAFLYSGVAGSANFKTLTATASNGVTVARAITATRNATQATTPTMQRAIIAVRNSTQTTTPITQRMVSTTKAVTSAAAATVASLKAKLLTLTATVASSAAVQRAVGLIRPVTQATTATAKRAINTTRSATQASTATTIRAISKFFAAVAAAAATVATQVNSGAHFLTLTATAGTTATLKNAISLTRAVSQASTAAAVRAVTWTRSITQASTATLTSIKVKLLTLAASSASVATLRRQIGAVRAIAQSTTTTAARVIAALHSVTQTSTTISVRAITWTRSVTQAATATIASIKVKLLTLVATSASSPTMRKAIGLIRSVVQSALAVVSNIITGGDRTQQLSGLRATLRAGFLGLQGSAASSTDLFFSAPITDSSAISIVSDTTVSTVVPDLIVK